MKLLVGAVVIETDNIETVTKETDHNVTVEFVSGNILQVVCGIQTTGKAFWQEDSDHFIQTLLNMDAKKVEPETTHSE